MPLHFHLPTRLSTSSASFISGCYFVRGWFSVAVTWAVDVLYEVPGPHSHTCCWRLTPSNIYWGCLWSALLIGHARIQVKKHPKGTSESRCSPFWSCLCLLKPLHHRNSTWSAAILGDSALLWRQWDKVQLSMGTMERFTPFCVEKFCSFTVNHSSVILIFCHKWHLISNLSFLLNCHCFSMLFLPVLFAFLLLLVFLLLHFSDYFHSASVLPPALVYGDESQRLNQIRADSHFSIFFSKLVFHSFYLRMEKTGKGVSSVLLVGVWAMWGSQRAKHYLDIYVPGDLEFAGGTICCYLLVPCPTWEW